MRTLGDFYTTASVCPGGAQKLSLATTKRHHVRGGLVGDKVYIKGGWD